MVNVTLLTTLLTAQLFGTDPANVYSTFGNGSPLAQQISEATIQAAQAEVTQYLRGCARRAGEKRHDEFRHGEFRAAPEDAMFETIQALNAKLAATHTTLEALSARIALGARACQTESIQITINGVKKPFCPVTKGGVPQETDIRIIDYQFKNIAEDTLTLQVRDDTVLKASFTPVGGSTFECAATLCGSITLGTLREDLSRAIDFASATLAGAAGGSALIDGTLIAPAPSITLPLLPCSENRFYVIFEDHDVVGDCVVDPPTPPPFPGFSVRLQDRGGKCMHSPMAGLRARPARRAFAFSSIRQDPSRRS